MPIGITWSQMVMESFSIPVSNLRQYLFCPRIPYLALMKGLKVKGGLWVHQGLSFHERTEMLTKRRNLSHYSLSASSFRFVANISLYDKELGLHGVCDGALYTKEGRVYPLEFKMAEGQAPTLATEIQLTAYAMLLEKKENIVIACGFILMGKRGKTYEIQFNQTKRLEVLRVVDSIRKSLNLAVMPTTPATSAQCCQCEYLNFCADRM